MGINPTVFLKRWCKLIMYVISVNIIKIVNCTNIYNCAIVYIIKIVNDIKYEFV